MNQTPPIWEKGDCGKKGTVPFLEKEIASLTPTS